jgi:periplasmic divalent cation tolerance protein
MMHVLLTTVEGRGKAEELARRMVEERLAACVTVIPGARSFYRWKGKMERAGEFVLLMKTLKPKELMKRLREVHPYEVPELLVLKVTGVSREYLRWVEEETR